MEYEYDYWQKADHSCYIGGGTVGSGVYQLDHVFNLAFCLNRLGDFRSLERHLGFNIWVQSISNQEEEPP